MENKLEDHIHFMLSGKRTDDVIKTDNAWFINICWCAFVVWVGTHAVTPVSTKPCKDFHCQCWFSFVLWSRWQHCENWHRNEIYCDTQCLLLFSCYTTTSPVTSMQLYFLKKKYVFVCMLIKVCILGWFGRGLMQVWMIVMALYFYFGWRKKHSSVKHSGPMQLTMYIKKKYNLMEGTYYGDKYLYCTIGAVVATLCSPRSKNG